MHRWKFVEGLETEIVQKATGGGEHRRPSRHVAVTDHANPATIEQGAHDRAAHRDPADLLDIAPGHRLTIGDQRQRLQQRPGIALGAFVPQPGDPVGQPRANAQLVPGGGLDQLHGASEVTLGQSLQRFLERPSRRALVFIEQLFEAVQRQRLAGGQQRRLYDVVQRIGRLHHAHAGSSPCVLSTD